MLIGPIVTDTINLIKEDVNEMFGFENKFIGSCSMFEIEKLIEVIFTITFFGKGFIIIFVNSRFYIFRY